MIFCHQTTLRKSFVDQRCRHHNSGMVHYSNMNSLIELHIRKTFHVWRLHKMQCHHECTTTHPIEHMSTIRTQAFFSLKCWATSHVFTSFKHSPGDPFVPIDGNDTSWRMQSLPACFSDNRRLLNFHLKQQEYFPILMSIGIDHPILILRVNVFAFQCLISILDAQSHCKPQGSPSVLVTGSMFWHCLVRSSQPQSCAVIRGRECCSLVLSLWFLVIAKLSLCRSQCLSDTSHQSMSDQESSSVQNWCHLTCAQFITITVCISFLVVTNSGKHHMEKCLIQSQQEKMNGRDQCCGDDGLKHIE